MIRFVLELNCSDNKVFRLQKDMYSWRIVGSGGIFENDFITSDVYEIIRLQTPGQVISLAGETYNVRSSPSSSQREGKEATYSILTFRDLFPRTPSKEQLAATIKQGDDNIDNSLVLNVYGYFELRPRETIFPYIDDPTIVTRNETFIAGNGYVGEDASIDNEFINPIYAVNLCSWATHLQTGATNMYSDDFDFGDKLEKALLAIEECRALFIDEAHKL